MADIPHNEDKRLLDRLNALKPSSVQLERQKNVALNNSAPSFSVFDNPADTAAAPGKLDDFATSSLLADGDIVPPESLLDGDAIEELLASLDNNQQLDIGGQSRNDIEQGKQEQDQERDDTNELLSGAYEFVQQSSLGPGDELNRSSRASSKREEDISHFLRDEEGEESSSDEENDEAEAAKYVEDLLKEIQANPPSESPTEWQKGETTSESNENRNNDSNRNIEDDDNLSTRLAALSLPSVPSDQLGTQRTTRKENTSPECCCICYDTPALRCTDCEGDQFFCVRCWWEMHMADGSDLTESRHKAFKYEPS